MSTVALCPSFDGLRGDLQTSSYEGSGRNEVRNKLEQQAKRRDNKAYGDGGLAKPAVAASQARAWVAD